ncbi:MAG: hypothetical protein K6T54_12230 [Ignavibacterium sp.]|nr:hypothetical protein [Ignavibacterium sp.]
MITRHDNELLTNSGANFKQLCLERTVAHAANIRLKEILKRRALFGNPTVVLLTNSGALTNSCASNPFFLKLL